MDTEYSYLCSKEKELDEELSQIRNRIKEILLEKKKANVGKYYKNHDNTEFYKVTGYTCSRDINQSGCYECAIIVFDEYKENNVFIDTYSIETLDRETYIEITEEDFYEQYNKALDIIRDRFNSKCNDSG